MARPSIHIVILALALALALALVAGGVRAGDGAFLGSIEDLPLMPGLEEAVEEGMVFESPSGRIAEAYASGAVSRERVRAFYAATLPQLGWRREGAGRYRREGEILDIEFDDGAPSILRVRFAVAPAEQE